MFDFMNNLSGGFGSKNNGGVLGFKRKYLDKIGDPLNIFGDAKRRIEDYMSGNSAEDLKAGYDQAMGQSKADAQTLMDFYDQRKGQALGYYAPMQQMFNNAYGGGIQGPKVPAPSGGGPLRTMYGGR